MIGIIFEVWPSEGKKQEYLEIAATLRPLLDQIDGFISIERFESLCESGKILSLSFFRDQEAVEQWRTLEAHRIAQATGRTSVFRDYRLPDCRRPRTASAITTVQQNRSSVLTTRPCAPLLIQNQHVFLTRF